MLILFYDSYCGICDFAVKFLIKIDRHEKLRFAPIGGETFHKLIKVSEYDSAIFHDGDNIFLKSEAILSAIYAIGGGWKLIVLLKIFPLKLRDLIYDYVAKNRQRQVCEFNIKDNKRDLSYLFLP